jgi:hypothetical protein
MSRDLWLLLIVSEVPVLIASILSFVGILLTISSHAKIAGKVLELIEQLQAQTRKEERRG